MFIASIWFQNTSNLPWLLCCFSSYMPNNCHYPTHSIDCPIPPFHTAFWKLWRQLFAQYFMKTFVRNWIRMITDFLPVYSTNSNSKYICRMKCSPELYSLPSNILFRAELETRVYYADVSSFIKFGGNINEITSIVENHLQKEYLVFSLFMRIQIACFFFFYCC